MSHTWRLTILMGSFCLIVLPLLSPVQADCVSRILRLFTGMMPNVERLSKLKVLGRHNEAEIVARLEFIDERAIIEIAYKDGSLSASEPFPKSQGAKKFDKLIQTYLEEGYLELPDDRSDSILHREHLR